MSTGLEFIPKAKTSELEAPWAGSPNCGVIGFSGEVEGAPNLKVNEKPGFVSFGASLCTSAGGLTGSPGDWSGIDCPGVNGFGPPVELPNPAKGVPAELPNENSDDVGPFCSELVGTGLGCIVAVVEGV